MGLFTVGKGKHYFSFTHGKGTIFLGLTTRWDQVHA